jgi:hypothetical protein
MSRYRKIEVRTWSDDNFRSLSALQPCGQGLWFYLLTGPQTGPIPGLYRAGRAQMAEELDWSLDAFYAAFAELEERGMARADWKARLVWLPNALKHNKPESPNVVRSWRVELDLLPECELKHEAIASMREAVTAMGQPFLNAFNEALIGVDPKASAKASPEALLESGTGAGTATATGNPTPAAPAPTQSAGPAEPPEDVGAPVTSADLANALLPFGILATPNQPHLVRMAAQGVTPDIIREACEEARRTRPRERITVAYVVGVLRRWKTEASTLDLAGAAAPKSTGGAWWATDPSILAKGAELGLSPRPGESMQAFKGRIQERIDSPGKSPPAPSHTIEPDVIEQARSRKPDGLDLKALVRQVPPPRAP